MMMIKSHAKPSSTSLFFNTITALIILRTIKGKTRLINDVKARQRNAKIRLLVYGLAYFRMLYEILSFHNKRRKEDPLNSEQNSLNHFVFNYFSSPVS